MKYPIGIQSFEKIRQGGFVYVDKTELIYNLVKNGTVYFLSRPRRFGKSLLIDTIDCYFSGRKELFEGLAIEKLETEWNRHPVFRVDFNGGDFTKPGALETRIESYISGWEDLYGKGKNENDTGMRFTGVLRRAYEQTGYKSVVLIDEYDKPLLDVIDSGLKNNEGTRLLEDTHRETLKAFYSTFKAADNYTQFVMLTGVTKFSQVSIFSGFNQPKDISMNDSYESLCGITMDEMLTYFKEPIGTLAEKMEMTFDQMVDRLKQHYDGYHFGTRMVDVFNPFSLLNALDSQRIRDYWFATGSPTYLIRLMNHFKEQIDELLNKEYREADFIDYKADVERPLPMLFQSGYLTIKKYDAEADTYFLDFPNNEVRGGFLSLLSSNYFDLKDSSESWAARASLMLMRGQLDAFRESLESFLASIPYNAHESLKDPKLSEKHFQYTFYLIMRLIGSYKVKTYVEQCQAQGRVDCIVEATDYIYIFEFKHNGSAKDALQQIEEKNYATPYLTDERKILLIGVNFTDETHNIDGWEVKELAR